MSFKQRITSMTNGSTLVGKLFKSAKCLTYWKRGRVKHCENKQRKKQMKTQAKQKYLRPNNNNIMNQPNKKTQTNHLPTKRKGEHPLPKKPPSSQTINHHHRKQPKITQPCDESVNLNHAHARKISKIIFISIFNFVMGLYLYFGFWWPAT